MATISASPAAGVGIRIGLDGPRRLRRPVPTGLPEADAPGSMTPTAVSLPDLLQQVPVRVLRLVAAGVGVFLLTLLASAVGGHLAHGAAPATPPAAVVVGESAAYPAYTVAPGDTLWTIAQRVNPKADPRATVMQLRVINGVGAGDVLQPGQVLQVPSHIGRDG